MTSKEKEHYSFSLLLCGVLLLLTDMYYHTHPLVAEKGFTFTLLDELVLMIRKGGALSSSVSPSPNHYMFSYYLYFIIHR